MPADHVPTGDPTSTSVHPPRDNGATMTLPERRRLGTRRPVRVGLIGAGNWGPNLARSFEDDAASGLVVVADLDAERLARLQRKLPGVRITTDYTTLFDMTLDAVAIATPAHTHVAIATAALEQGLNCLVETPLAMNVRDARALVALARANDRRLMVGHTVEFNPAVVEMRRMIQAGVLGEVYFIDAVRTNLGHFQVGTDAMWDLAPHDVSTANFLLDDHPVRVTAQAGSYVLRGVNDLVYLHLEYPGGRLVSIRVSWIDPGETRRTTVVGDAKMLVYDDLEQLEKLRLYDRGLDAPPGFDAQGEFTCSYRYGDVTIPHIPWEEPLRLETRHFVEAVAAGANPRSDGTSGLRVVEVLEAAERSLALGRGVDIAEVRFDTDEHGAPARGRP
jgi:predicted dehydrogenase